jgi:RimJ/RimL family protein N-acetyltransferase
MTPEPTTALIERRYSRFRLGGPARFGEGRGMPFDPKPVQLDGRFVRLEPLAPHHAEDLLAAGREPGIWTYMPMPPFDTAGDVLRWIDEARRLQEAGSDVAFATVRRSDGLVVGSTRYLDIRRPHRALEIGYTWLAPEAQRTVVNTEAKYLMLRHAFEAYGAVRVQLKTDERNEKSRRAILRLGARFEGVLRNYQTRPHDGYVRNTAMYAITDREWPEIKARLEAKLLR